MSLFILLSFFLYACISSTGIYNGCQFDAQANYNRHKDAPWDAVVLILWYQDGLLKGHAVNMFEKNGYIYSADPELNHGLLFGPVKIGRKGDNLMKLAQNAMMGSATVIWAKVADQPFKPIVPKLK